MDININCEWEQSKINPRLRICKRCKYVSGVADISHDHRICPVLIDSAARNPEYKQIRLEKILTVQPDGTVKEEIIPQSHFNDWWPGGETTINIPTASILNKNNTNHPKQNLNKQSVTTEKQQVQGKPCSQEQIDARLAICQGCEFYKNNSCLKCGCALSRDRNYMNKLYWADKSCPIGKWGPVE